MSTIKKLTQKEREAMHLQYQKDGTIPDGYYVCMMKGQRPSFRRDKSKFTIDDHIERLDAKIAALTAEVNKLRLVKASTISEDPIEFNHEDNTE